MANTKEVVDVAGEMDIVIAPKAPLEFNTNFAELKKELKKKLRKYKGMKVADSNFEKCKLVQKQCVASRNLLENRRREAMKAFIEMPKNKLQAEFQELQALIAEVEENIKEQMDVYEAERVEELRCVLQGYVEEFQEEFQLQERFLENVELNKKYFNKTAKEADTIKDIKRQFEEQKAEQEEYEANVALIRKAAGDSELINVEKYVKELDFRSVSAIVIEIESEIQRLTSVLETSVTPSEKVTLGIPSSSSAVFGNETQEESSTTLISMSQDFVKVASSLHGLDEEDLGEEKTMKISLTYPEGMGKLIKAFFESYPQIKVAPIKSRTKN